MDDCRSPAIFKLPKILTKNESSTMYDVPCAICDWWLVIGDV